MRPNSNLFKVQQSQLFAVLSFLFVILFLFLSYFLFLTYFPVLFTFYIPFFQTTPFILCHFSRLKLMLRCQILFYFCKLVLLWNGSYNEPFALSHKFETEIPSWCWVQRTFPVDVLFNNEIFISKRAVTKSS